MTEVEKQNKRWSLKEFTIENESYIKITRLVGKYFSYNIEKFLSPESNKLIILCLASGYPKNTNNTKWILKFLRINTGCYDTWIPPFSSIVIVMEIKSNAPKLKYSIRTEKPPWCAAYCCDTKETKGLEIQASYNNTEKISGGCVSKGFQ